MKDHVGVISTLTPYHGWQKGIFLGRHDDALSAKDQALVVADMDPVHVVGGKPRPQLLPPPLRLVAYLPLVELLDPATNSAGLGKELAAHLTIGVDLSAQLRWVHDSAQPAAAAPADFLAAYSELADLMQAGSALDGSKLEAFSQKFSDPAALRARLLCWHKDLHQQPHLGQLAGLEPPALVDFLAADLTLKPGQELATVRVPAWCPEAGPSSV